MDADPTPLKPQCDEALHEIYHLLSGQIDDQKRAQIAAHLDEGNVSEARRQYHLYRELVWDALGVEPSHGLRALIWSSTDVR